MRYWRNAFVVPMVFGLYLVASVAGQEKSKPPPLPKIDPGQARLTATLGGLDGPGFDVAYHPQTNILAAGCEFGTVQYWEEDVLEGVRQGGHTPNVLKGHQGPVLEVAWNGGPFLASAGADKKIILWSMPDGKPAKTIPVPTVVRALAMSPDGKTLAASNDDNSIDLYDVASGKPRAKLTAHTDWVTALCFSPDGKLLASGGPGQQHSFVGCRWPKDS
ncbi:MAG: hypothetical protein KatS3mg105_3893 [Gemmatales bacterium]|nr:MAG: hypothetical protein KatS3mg105_3893 [Gemmatales bacterium]